MQGSLFARDAKMKLLDKIADLDKLCLKINLIMTDPRDVKLRFCELRS